MKFWKIVNLLVVAIFPEWRDMFLSYKVLKKHLNLKYPKPAFDDPPPPKRRRLSSSEPDPDPDDDRDEVAGFVRLLDGEIEKLNKFFRHKEEDYVIVWKELKDEIAKARDANEDLTEVGKKVVDLHGDMILLQTYSILNYTGLVKIMKKHDKRSGALIRLPFIQRVLGQPFFSTDVVSNLAKECEATLDIMFSVEELAEITHLDTTYPKLIRLALRVLQEIRRESSTVGPLSLPPMERSVVDDLERR